MAGAQWFLFKNGTCATNHFESCGFVKSDPGVAHPDIEIQFIPVVMKEAGESEIIQHGYQVNCPCTNYDKAIFSLHSGRPLTRSLVGSRTKTILNKRKHYLQLLIYKRPTFKASELFTVQYETFK